MIVSVKGAELFYSTRGNGPACLFLSGIGTRPYELQTPPQLSDRLKLVYVDLRGSRQSAAVPPRAGADALLRSELRRHSASCGGYVTVDSSSLRVPMFLAHGRYDYTVPYLLWEGIPSRLPNATFEIFEKSGHQPFFEEPDRFAETVMKWFAAETG